MLMLGERWEKIKGKGEKEWTFSCFSGKESSRLNLVTVKSGIVKMTRSLSGTWEDNLQLTVLLLVKAFALLLFLCFFSHCTVKSLEQKFLLIVTLEYREYRGSPRWLNLLLGKILVLRRGTDTKGRNLEDEFVSNRVLQRWNGSMKGSTHLPKEGIY